MRIQLIKEKVQGQLDVDSAFAEFQKNTGRDDPESFLEHLKDTNKISGTLFCEIHAAEEISVSQFGGSLIGQTLQGLNQQIEIPDVPDDGATFLQGMNAAPKNGAAPNPAARY